VERIQASEGRQKSTAKHAKYAKWFNHRERRDRKVTLNAQRSTLNFSRILRIKPHAIDIRVDVDPVHWFLNEKEDTRSSYYLEDAATEFQVQGLELD